MQDRLTLLGEALGEDVSYSRGADRLARLEAALGRASVGEFAKGMATNVASGAMGAASSAARGVQGLTELGTVEGAENRLGDFFGKLAGGIETRTPEPWGRGLATDISTGVGSTLFLAPGAVAGPLGVGLLGGLSGGGSEYHRHLQERPGDTKGAYKALLVGGAAGALEAATLPKVMKRFGPAADVLARVDRRTRGELGRVVAGDLLKEMGQEASQATVSEILDQHLRQDELSVLEAAFKVFQDPEIRKRIAYQAGVGGLAMIPFSVLATAVQESRIRKTLKALGVETKPPAILEQGGAQGAGSEADGWATPPPILGTQEQVQPGPKQADTPRAAAPEGGEPGDVGKAPPAEPLAAPANNAAPEPTVSPEAAPQSPARNAESVAPDAPPAQPVAEENVPRGTLPGAGAAPAGPGPTSLKWRMADEELSAMGRPPSKHGQKMTKAEALADAEATFRRDPDAGRKILAELERTGRPTTGQETVILLWERNRQRVARDLLQGELEELLAAGDTDAAAVKEKAIREADDAYAKTSDITTTAGTVGGQGLAFRQLLMNQDYSLAEVTRKARNANVRGAVADEQLQAQVRDLTSRLTKVESELASRSVQDAQRDARTAARRRNRVLERLSKEADAARARQKARGMRMYSGFDAAELVDEIIIGADYIARGVESFADWSAAMAKEFGDGIRRHLPEIYSESKARAADAETEDIIERLAERRDRLQGRLDSGDIAPRGKKPLPDNEEVRRLVAEIDGLLAELRDRQVAAKTEEQAASELEATIKRLEGLIASGSEHRSVGPDSPRLRELRSRKAQLARLRARPSTQEQRDARSIRSAKTRARNEARKLLKQLESGEVTPQPRAKVVLDAEARELRARAEKLRRDVRKLLRDTRLKNRTRTEKILAIPGQAVGLSRSLLASSDMPPMFRQGVFIGLSHPGIAVEQMGHAIEAMRSDHRRDLVEQKIKENPLYDTAISAGMHWTSTDGGDQLSPQEEVFQSDLAERIPVVRGSNRGFSTYLNGLRMAAFAHLYNSVPGGKPTPQQAQDIANFVNVATGRGSGSWAKSADAFNKILWAPRLYLSRIQLLVGPFTGLRRGLKIQDPQIRRLIAREYARFLRGSAVLYSLALIAGADIEKDPRSSDFGKLVVGNTRLDPMGGFLQYVVLGARGGSGVLNAFGADIKSRKTTDGKVDDFSSSDIGRFIRSKLAPGLGQVWDISVGQNPSYEDVNFTSGEGLWNLTKNTVIPMSWTSLAEAMVEHGMPAGAVMSTLSLFGMGMQTYENEKRREAAKAKENMKAMGR